MADKTSLEKSHSKASNAKLTFICFLAAIAVSLLWIGIGFVSKGFDGTFGLLGIIFLATGACGTVFTLFLINKFTR